MIRIFFDILRICFVKQKNKQMFERLFTNIIIRSILNTSKIEGDDTKILKGYVFRLYPNKIKKS